VTRERSRLKDGTGAWEGVSLDTAGGELVGSVLSQSSQGDK
jgi:hypothetical protein